MAALEALAGTLVVGIAVAVAVDSVVVEEQLVVQVNNLLSLPSMALAPLMLLS